MLNLIAIRLKSQGKGTEQGRRVHVTHWLQRMKPKPQECRHLRKKKPGTEVTKKLRCILTPTDDVSILTAVRSTRVSTRDMWNWELFQETAA
jgi:hypothetical protein